MICCNTPTKLIRGDHLYGGVVVENAEAHVCTVCNKVVGWPHTSSGRIALAVYEQTPDYIHVLDFPVPIELIDRAMCLNAVLGKFTTDTFTLAFHLGLQRAGEEPSDYWKVLDDLPRGHTARLYLRDSTHQRLKALAKHWNTTEGNVFRWLTLVAFQAYI